MNIPPTAPKLRLPSQRKGTGHRRSTTERGYGHDHQDARRRVLAEHPVCERCRASWSHHLHHVNRLTHDRSPSNLEALCEACHRKEHGSARQ